MATVVVPFRSGGKSRLPAAVRVDLALAMLGDVLEAAAAHAGHVRLVTDDAAAVEIAAVLGVEVIADPGGGQGAAVQAALGGLEGACLVVNADLPGATPAALARLEALAPALVAAADGTTNALALPGARLVRTSLRLRQRRPLRGPGPRPGLDPRARARRRHAPRPPRAPRSRAAHPAARPANGPCVESTQGHCGAHRVNVVLLSGGVGGRQARSRAARRARAGRADDRRQRRRRPGGARALRLARPRLRPLRPRGPERHRARLGAGRRDVAGARVGAHLGRGGLVHARRPRHRPPSRALAGAPRR